MAYRDWERQREYQRTWQARRRAAWLEGQSCVRCGASEDLHVHHRDPEQKVSHTVWSWREDRRLAELAKCEVLCRSCHEEHHAALLRRHGTRGRYKKGCRCEPCRAAKARENARYRARRFGVAFVRESRRP